MTTTTEGRTDMAELIELIEKCWQDDPSDTATAVMDEISMPEPFRSMFIPILRGECVRQARAIVRETEQRATGGAKPATSASTRSASHRTLLENRFFNGETYVLYGDATIEDHEGRIKYQRSFRDGIDRDIQLHRRVISIIKNAGATCLREVSNWEMLLQDGAA